jgi:diphthamide synthase (EF-2-diphthine--ammonia ligase)
MAAAGKPLDALQEVLGREMDASLLADIVARAPGVDECGERGEMHTVVLDGPTFRSQLRISGYTRRVEGAYAYLADVAAQLDDKLFPTPP